MSKAPRVKPRHWRPLRPAEAATLRPEVLTAAAKQYNISEDEARRRIEAESPEFWLNDLYQVQVSYCSDRGHAGTMHLNIRRRDGAADSRDWRHFQEIKNQLAGPEREAFEIYPAESRKVDTSNKFHLWVLPEGERVPVGWQERDVQYEENKNVPGIRQRPL
jgi:hypothetical protein